MTTTTTPPRTFQVTRAARHDDSTDPDDDGLILIDGRRIGGTYLCGTHIPAVRRWASYGPCGYLHGDHGFPTREAAEQAQVREYATNPDLYDRLNDQANAQLAADQAEREARWEAEIAEAKEQARLRRCGDDEPGPTVWTLPAYHVMYAPEAETAAVAAWLDANGIEDVSAVHAMRVEQRATRRVLVYESPTRLARLASAMNNPTVEGMREFTETWVATITTDPPPITSVARPDLHALFDEHWPSRFPLIDYGANMACGHCTQAAHATTVAALVLWPCPPVLDAIGGPAGGAAGPFLSGWAGVDAADGAR